MGLQDAPDRTTEPEKMEARRRKQGAGDREATHTHTDPASPSGPVTPAPSNPPRRLLTAGRKSGCCDHSFSSWGVNSFPSAVTSQTVTCEANVH